MATIALYASKVNNMPSLLEDAKGAVRDLKDELFSLKWKCAQVNTDVCNLEDVVNTVSSATQLQEDKITALGSLKDSITTFADETARIDGDVAELLNQRKDDFYEKYYYLKPECEKTGWEKFCDGCKKASDWCAENWEALCVLVAAVVAVAAIVALSIVTFGASAVVIAALVGAAIGLAGQLIGDTIAFATTGKWESSWYDYVGAAFGGAIGGILTMSGNAVAACAAESAITSLFSDSLGSITGDKKKTLGEMLVNCAFDAAVGAVAGWGFGKLTDKLVKVLPKNTTFLKRLSGRNSYSASYKMALTRLKNGTYKKITTKTIRNGVISGMVGDFLKNVIGGTGVTDIPVNLAHQLGLPEAIDSLMNKPWMAKNFHWQVVSRVTGLRPLSILGMLPAK